MPTAPSISCLNQSGGGANAGPLALALQVACLRTNPVATPATHRRPTRIRTTCSSSLRWLQGVENACASSVTTTPHRMAPASVITCRMDSEAHGTALEHLIERQASDPRRRTTGRDYVLTWCTDRTGHRLAIPHEIVERTRRCAPARGLPQTAQTAIGSPPEPARYVP